ADEVRPSVGTCRVCGATLACPHAGRDEISSLLRDRLLYPSPALRGESRREETTVAVELNERQREAVAHGEGPLLVLAGAGSGKTRVITTRIATLVAAGTRPSAILALTFTNKAASEMRHRLGAMLGAQASELWMSTFHSAAAQILRRHIHHLGYTSTFSIYDDQDTGKLLRQCMAEEGVGDQAGAASAIAWAIDRAKNEGLGPDELARRPLAGDAVVRVYAR